MKILLRIFKRRRKMMCMIFRMKSLIVRSIFGLVACMSLVYAIWNFTLVITDDTWNTHATLVILALELLKICFQPVFCLQPDILKDWIGWDRMYNKIGDVKKLILGQVLKFTWDVICYVSMSYLAMSVLVSDTVHVHILIWTGVGLTCISYGLLDESDGGGGTFIGFVMPYILSPEHGYRLWEIALIGSIPHFKHLIVPFIRWLQSSQPPQEGLNEPLLTHDTIDLEDPVDHRLDDAPKFQAGPSAVHDDAQDGLESISEDQLVSPREQCQDMDTRVVERGDSSTSSSSMSGAQPLRPTALAFSSCAPASENNAKPKLLQDSVRSPELTRILQTETSLKSKMERWRENYSAVQKRCDRLTKEKDDLNKAMLALSKQVKRNVEDSASEQANKEKDRIQILEKTVERYREEVKKLKDELKEKEQSDKTEKTHYENLVKVTQEKKLLADELSKTQLQDEVQNIKTSGGSQPKITPVATTSLEDIGSAEFSAVGNLVQAATPSKPDPAAPSNTPPKVNMYPDVATVSQSVALSTKTPEVTPVNVAPVRASEDREKSLVARANIKTGRRLVRPSLSKPKEIQGDVEMSEPDESKADESNIGTSSLDIDQGNLPVSTKSPVRKHSSDEILALEEGSPDLTTPAPKKLKSLESFQDSGEEPSAAPVNFSDVAANDEIIDEQGNNTEEPGKEGYDDTEKDDPGAPGEEVDEPAPTEQLEAGEITEEKSDMPKEAVHSDDQFRHQTEQDNQRIVTESEEREEGELDTELTDADGDGNIPEVGEYLRDESVEPPRSPSIEPPRSPSIEPRITETLEAGEIDPSDQEDEKNDSSGMTEKLVDGSDKLLDAVGSVVETQSIGSSSSSSAVEASGSTSAGIDALGEEQARQRVLESMALRSVPTRGRVGPAVRGRPGPSFRGRPPRGVRGRGVRGRPPRGGQSPG